LSSFVFSSRRRHTRSKRDWSSDVCSSDLKPIEETNGEYGTNPKNPATVVMIPVNENERRYSFLEAYAPYISSVPLSEPNVFAELSRPANTVVIIIPVFQVGLPNGNNSKLIPPPAPPLVDSAPKINVCAIQPTTIPINSPYLRTLVGALI